MRGWIGLGDTVPADSPVIGLGHFATDEFLFFYLYVSAAVAAFAYMWERIEPHKWRLWSVLGTALILFSTYYSVQVSVAINNWRRPFFDSVQSALDQNPETIVSSWDLYWLLWVFAQIAMLWTVIYVLTRFW